MKKILFIITVSFLGIFFSLKNIQAYDPPIGIPDPGMWGTTHPIDSVAPDTAIKCPAWPSAQTDNCYYIDNTHPQATDINNIYGYPDKPRLTIPSGTYAAGSYIEIHGGPYINEKIMTMSGTAENPIWFRGASNQTKPIFKAKQSFTNSTYLFIENLEFSDITGGVVSFSSSNAHHIVLRNSYFHDMTYPGSSASVIGVTPVQDGSIHDMVFYNNNFHTIGDWMATSDDDYHCINPSLWGRTPPTTIYNFWVLNNTADQVSGNLVQFNGDQRDAARGDSETPIRLITNTNMQNSHHHYVGKNVMHHSRQSISSHKFSTDVIVSQNYGYDNYNHASAGASGEVYQEGANYVWFLFNRFNNQDWGIRQSNTNFSTPNGDALTGIPSEKMANLHVYVIGNSIEYTHNTKGNNYINTFVRNHTYKLMQAFCAEKGYYTRHIVDNTVYNTGGGFNFVNDNAITRLSGNVIAGVQGYDSNGLPEYHGSFFSSGIEETIDYTFFQPRADDGTVRFRWFAPAVVYPTSLNDFKNITGQCSNCYVGDPQFADPQNYNFRPKAGSPLIGKNIRHPVYNEFEQRYGISIAYDFDGNPRPSSGNWTLGAFEYASGQVQSESCSDNIQNQDETEIDCGGVCDACIPVAPAPTYNIANFISTINNWLGTGNADSDVNSDNIVNTRDLGIIMSGWE